MKKLVLTLGFSKSDAIVFSSLFENKTHLRIEHLPVLNYYISQVVMSLRKDGNEVAYDIILLDNW